MEMLAVEAAALVLLVILDPITLVMQLAVLAAQVRHHQYLVYQ